MTSFWALDLGEAEIAAVRIAADRRIPEISEVAFAPIPASPSGRGPAETRQALLDLVRRLHLRRTVVHVGGAGTRSVLRDELLSQEDLDGTPETVRRRLLDLLPGDLDSREVRYVAGARAEGDDDLVPYRLLSVPRDEVSRSHGLIADADMERAALHSGALALTAAAERLPPSTEPFALLRIGRRVTALSVHHAGRVERFRIPTGEEDLAEAVAAARSVPTMEAYALLTAGPDEPEAIETARALAAPLDALARDVLRLLEYQEARHADSAPRTVHPVGSVATRPHVAARLAAVPELRCGPLPKPPAGLVRWTGRARTEEIAEIYPRLYGAIGVGLLGARPRNDPLVLRPLPPAPERVRVGIHLVASVLLLLLVGLAWWSARRDREALVALDAHQHELAERIPTGTRSRKEVEADRRAVAAKLGYLGRKVAVRRALLAVDAIFPRERRKNETYLLESLRYDGERVTAVLLVRVPRGTDVRAVAEAHRSVVPNRIREILGTAMIPSVELVPGGYRLRAELPVGEP